jgi:hypothetical protein
MRKRTSIGLAAVAATIILAGYAVLRNGSSLPPETPPAAAETTPFESCAYVWAYQDLPEISARLEQAIGESFPEADAHASAYGEDCVYADGRAVFGAMETDFYVSLPVADIKDQTALGNHIASVMSIILDRFPRQEIPGARDGFVEFRFEHSETELLLLRVSIQRYKTEAAGKTGEELFQLFQSRP